MSEGDVKSSPVPGGLAAGTPGDHRRADPAAVESLLAAARAHPLGLGYLVDGYLGSVAATFGVHAFVVEEARRQLRQEQSGAKRSHGTFPESVVACECWARDGLQSMPVLVSTDDKVEMIQRVIDAGFPKVEVTSFSHPKLLPQFADAEEVLKQIRRKPGVSCVVLMPNTRGFDRLEVCQKEGRGADEIILMISASERHNKLNFRMAHTEAMAEHAAIIKRSHALGIRVIGCAGTVYGCPVAGDISTAEVAKIVRFYLEEGAQTIMLGDTTGVANPRLVRERVRELMSAFPTAEFIAHFHDTRGSGVANTLAMLELGIRYVDCSIGAIGGQPATGAAKYSAGYTGNTCSEDLVAILGEMGIRTGIEIEQLIDAGLRAEQILGQRLRSNVIRCGPVIHGESAPDKEAGSKVAAPPA
jgi:hydroxymethylglutaryl-CoA lyase